MNRHKSIVLLDILVIIVLPVLFGFLLVSFFGVNAPFWDEWNNISAYFEFRDSTSFQAAFAVLFEQNNEHRILTQRLLFYPVMTASHWNIKLAMYISQVFLFITYFLFFHRLPAWDNSDKRSFSYYIPFLVLSSVLYSPIQWENLLWGFQAGWMMLQFLAVACFWCFYKYLERQKTGYFILSCLLMVLAVFSSLQGLAIGIVYVLMWIIRSLSDKYGQHVKGVSDEKNYGAYAILIVLYTVCAFTYFIGYERPEWIPDYSFNPVKLLLFFFSVSGTIFTPYLGDESGIIGNVVYLYGTALGFLFVFITVYIFIYCIKHGIVREYYFELSVILFSLGFRGMVTLGRYGLGVSYLGAASRYTSFSTIAFAAAFLIIYKEFLKGRISLESIKIINTGKAVVCSMAVLWAAILLYSAAAFYPCHVLKTKRETGRDIILNYENASLEDFRNYVGVDADTIEEAKKKVERLKNNDFYPFHGRS